MNKWILDLEKTREKMQKYNEKEMPKYITFFYYYISTNNEIDKITRQKFKTKDFTSHAQNFENKKTITSGELLHAICEHRTNPSYILDEILLFQQDKITPLPLTISDIEIKPSLFIYHDVNCVFIIYRQRGGDGHTELSKTRRAAIAKKKYTRRRHFTKFSV